MKALYDQISFESSKLITRRYSTSFSLGIYFLDKRFHEPIYGIYGFVRLADEIVDTFHQYNKRDLFDRFRDDTWRSIADGISLNPVLNAFQHVVNTYNVDYTSIETFLKSMEMDLQTKQYGQGEIENYILGSAEVVGLMCLRVFTEGNDDQYNKLKPFAMALGSAFQKINFLRDLKADYKELGRTYFPNVDIHHFDDITKSLLEKEIEHEFNMGYEGILMLPKGVRFGVYVAYVYYFALLRKIRNTPAHVILNERVRIPNKTKYKLLFTSYLRHSFNLL